MNLSTHPSPFTTSRVILDIYQGLYGLNNYPFNYQIHPAAALSKSYVPILSLIVSTGKNSLRARDSIKQLLLSNWMRQKLTK